MSFGLGRGLEALIPQKKPIPRPQPQSIKSDSPVAFGQNEVELKKIIANPWQPRKSFNLEKLQELAESIKEHGLIEPLMVSPGVKPDTYILVAGERRLRASELAGLTKVPVTLRTTSDQEKLELALVENIQRQDLNPLEEAKALRKLINDFSLTQNEAAKKVGRSRPAVANIMRLLELAPECQKKLLEEKISAGHAVALLSITSETKQVEVLRQVLELNLSVRETERLAKKVQSGSIKSTATNNQDDLKHETTHDRHMQEVGKQLSRKLGTKVNLVTAHDGGRIVIEYYSDDERDRLVSDLLKEKNSVGDRGQTFTKRRISNNFSV